MIFEHLLKGIMVAMASQMAITHECKLNLAGIIVQIIKSFLLLGITSFAISCSAGQSSTPPCVGLKTTVDLQKDFALRQGALLQGPFDLALGPRKIVKIAVFQNENKLDAPLELKIAQEIGNGCWLTASPLSITGVAEFGIRSKTLTPVSVFSEQVDKDSQKEIILIYSAYIDGTGTPENFAAAIIRVDGNKLVRLTGLEQKFMRIATAQAFRQAARRRRSN